MNKEYSVSGSISESDLQLTLKTGKLAPLAHGAVFAQIGGTSVLATAVMSKAREGTDFFPLTVDVEERMYAAGKIPGSFFRREGRPSEIAILNSRLIDRPLRPVFPDDFREEVQIVVTVMSADQENPHDILALNAASAALSVSGIPFNGPVGAVHLSYIDGEWIANGTYEQRSNAIFEIVVAGRKVGEDIAIMMVEAGGNEGSTKKYDEGISKVDEAELAKALDYSKQWIKSAIEIQENLVGEVGEIQTREYTPNVDYSAEIFDNLKSKYGEKVQAALNTEAKEERSENLNNVLEEILAAEFGDISKSETTEEVSIQISQIKKAFSSLQKQLLREKIINEKVRIDGRKLDELRQLSAEVDVLPTTHGTGLFQRGETQVLSVATLGMPNMKQTLDTIGSDVSKRYMHHYNFPPSSVGETGRVGSPKRREIGHGALAERALVPVLPSENEWPYAMRVVSDVLSSNGSTSMASVCGSTLSLMDSGVPLIAPVAGIAMGLINEGDDFVTLTDIQGAEDAFGDMDFKVAGTSDYITALQLDTKIDGIPADILAGALEQAKTARLTILELMNSVIKDTGELGKNAPKIIRIDVPEDKVGEIIGPKGKTINAIQDSTGADVSVEDGEDGPFVVIGASNSEAAKKAEAEIDAIVNPPVPEVNQVYNGKVVSITKYGAFVNILPGTDGLIHISQLGAEGERAVRVEDYLSQDQEVEVIVSSIDDRGKISLTLKGDSEKKTSDNGSSSSNAKQNSSKASTNKEDNSKNEKGKQTRGKRKEVSFEDYFNNELESEFGDLGTIEDTK